MRIRESIELDYDDVLLMPKHSTLSSRSEVQLERTFKTPYGSIAFCPVLAANMYNTGSLAMGIELAKYSLGIAYHKFILEQNERIDVRIQVRPASFFSIGMKDKDLSMLEVYRDITYYRDNFNICIDVANGHQEYFVDFVKKVRTLYPQAFIMAGNVVTGSMTEQLILAGANIVKVGIGPGSYCTTRLVAGVGRPQFSAIVECADAAHGMNGYICADGGIKQVGDIAKAFGANADMVMIGGLFMGYQENDGQRGIVPDGEYGGKHTIQSFGMSSREAQDQFNGGLADYRAAEGEAKWIELKGSVQERCQEIRGGLASACTYIGASSIKDMGKCAEFVRVNRIK